MTAKNKKITILLVNYNTSKFVEILLFSLQKLTLSSYKVIICDNGSNDNEILQLSNTVRKYKDVDVIFRLQSVGGSIAHGQALDILIEKVNTKYTVIMDSDCVLLMRGWDKYMINQIKNKIQMVGSAEIEDVNVNRIGTSFVLPFLCMFNTKTFKSLKISCLPGDIKKGQDVCWEWEKKYKEKNFECSKFIGKSTRRNNKIEFSDIVGVENYYTKDNKIIASHFGRGSSLGFAKYKSWYFKSIPYLSKILNNFYGQSQINKWIFKSKKIIERSL